MIAKYKIKIVDTLKGEEVNITKAIKFCGIDENKLDSQTKFAWMDGIEACDYSRAQYFMDNSKDKNNVPCGKIRFRVEIKKVDGSIIYTELRDGVEHAHGRSDQSVN